MKQEVWNLGIVNSSKTAQPVLSEASVFRGKWPTWGCVSSGRLLYCMERIFSSLSLGTHVCYTESIYLMKTRYFYGNFSSFVFFYYTLYKTHPHNDCDFLQQSTCMKEKKTKQSNNDWSLKVTEINGYQCKYKVFPVFSLNSRDHMKCEHRPHWF